MDEFKLRPRVVLWWGIGLTAAGLVLTVVLPNVLFVWSAQQNVSTGVDQGMLALLELILRLLAQVVPPLGVALIGASVVMAYLGRIVGRPATFAQEESGPGRDDRE